MAKRNLTDEPGDDELSPAEKEDAEIIEQARRRFKRAYEFEADFRPQYIEDIKFASADSDNHWQWPSEVYNARVSDTSKRPTLTVNIVQSFSYQITNDFKQNMPSIAIKPTGDESTFDSAQIYEALSRHVEYSCNARAIYMDAYQSQVDGGVGYCRVNTKYIDDETFNQTFVIEPVRSHLGVLLDPDIKQKDGSDAKFGFIFDEIPKTEFERLFPDIDLPPTNNTLDISDDWVREDSVRIAEYYRILEEADELIYFKDEQGQSVQFRMSEMPKEMEKALRAAEKRGVDEVRRRRVWNRKLQWFKIAGTQIVDRRLELPGSGKYIPIVRFLGREKIIDGKLDRKGIVRPLKDTQRILNYYISTDAEFNALQPKSPYIGPAAAFEGNETTWNKLNTSNPAWLPFNHRDEDGEEIPAPQRNPGPTDAPAYANGINRALQQMSLISGMNDAKQGITSNERSGLAIQERRRGADNANYDFAENAAQAVTYIGRIFIDWAPDIYDTEQVIKVMARDGTQSEIAIDPNADQAAQIKLEQDVEKVLFNPAVGKYEVQANVGPSFATQREQAWDAFVGVLTKAPELVAKIGDLTFRTADFPLSDKIAERLERDIEHNAPWLLKDGEPPAIVQELTTQLQQVQGMFAQSLDQIGKLEKKLQDQQIDLQRKETEVGIKAFDAHTKRYDAESKRVTAISNAQPELDRTGDDQGFEAMMRATIEDVLKSKGVANDDSFHPSMIGAKEAPDGNHYLPDPTRPGKYLRVDHAGSAA
jgi:hypothetical protein